MPKTDKYPSRILEDKLRERGLEPRLMWEMRGPKDTGIKWISCYFLEKNLILVETFDGGGWNAFTPDLTNNVEATVEDVIARCCPKVPA